MRHLGLVLALCGAAGLALAPVSVNAFEIQGKDQDTPDSAAEFHGLGPVYSLPQFDGYSLAMPYNSTSVEGAMSRTTAMPLRSLRRALASRLRPGPAAPSARPYPAHHHG